MLWKGLLVYFKIMFNSPIIGTLFRYNKCIMYVHAHMCVCTCGRQRTILVLLLKYHYETGTLTGLNY